MPPASEQADSGRFSETWYRRAGIDEIPHVKHLLQQRRGDRGSGRNGKRRADNDPEGWCEVRGVAKK